VITTFTVKINIKVGCLVGV